MHNRRYPKDLVLTKDDFDEKEFHEVLSHAERHLYTYMYSLLMNTAESYIQEGNIRKGKMYWILQDACSMMLTPNNADQPFEPLMIWDGMRSTLPEDFVERDILFFASIIPLVNDPLMKARLADLVWVRSRVVDYALTAIDSYVETPITNEKWFGSEGSDYWRRAIVLAKELGEDGQGRMQMLEAKMADSVINYDDAHKDALYEVVGLMLRFELGKNQAKNIANALENHAKQDRENVYFAPYLHDFLAKWRKILDNKEVEMSHGL